MAEQKENIISVVHQNMEPYARETFNRAFPSYADHLKPVTRRIIFSMWEMDVTTAFRKVAQVVGYVMGRYHPHGDSSISEALVNLAQPFGLNHPLITGQGAFGNTDGDRASAPRYIECKLSPFARDVITDDIDRHSVEYVDNYDYTSQEPVYLPTKLPLLLINGAEGIGVGFAVSAPPHNLNDVVTMVTRFIKNKGISLEKLVDGIYPDFPTYGIITNPKEIAQIYKTGGTGTIKIRAKYELDQQNGVIRISEIPFNKNGQAIKTRIKELSSGEDIVLSNAILNVHDVDKKDPLFENDEAKMQFEIICKKEANLQQVMQKLLEKTALSSFFNIRFLLGYGDRVREVNILEIIQEWYSIRANTIHRKHMHEFSALENRYHVNEGLYNAYDQIDEIIKTIRSLAGKEETLEALHKKFGFTVKQAEGIYEMSLGSLGKTPKIELKNRMEKARERINEIQKILENVDQYILDEIDTLKKKYGRPRRSVIMETVTKKTENSGDQSGVSSGQEIKAILKKGGILWNKFAFGIFNDDGLATGKKVTMGLKGDGKIITGAAVVEKDLVGVLILFLNGNALRLDAIDIPSTNVWIPTENQSEIFTVVPIYSDTKGFMMINKLKKVKRVILDDFSSRRVVGMGEPIVVITQYCSDKDEVLCMTQSGRYFFDVAENFPIVGRTASGVKTNFEDSDVLTMFIPNRVDNDLINLFLKRKNEPDYYLHSMFFNKLKKVKRTSMYKNLLGKVENFELVAITQSLNESKNSVFLVTEDQTQEVSARNFKKTNHPKKLGSSAFYGISSSREK